MDEAQHAELLRRVRAHPAFHGGPADEGYWLDLMELHLAKFGSYEFKIEMLADSLERHPERLPTYVAASEYGRHGGIHQPSSMPFQVQPRRS